MAARLQTLRAVGEIHAAAAAAAAWAAAAAAAAWRMEHMNRDSCSPGWPPFAALFVETLHRRAQHRRCARRRVVGGRVGAAYVGAAAVVGGLRWPMKWRPPLLARHIQLRVVGSAFPTKTRSCGDVWESQPFGVVWVTFVWPLPALSRARPASLYVWYRTASAFPPPARLLLSREAPCRTTWAIRGSSSSPS